jgi:hypothetical protein
MRIPSTSFRPGHQNGFSARRTTGRPFSGVHRLLTHWFRRATDRSIGAQLCDLRLNPFLFLTESGC